MSNIVDMDEESDVETPEVVTERSQNIPKLGSQMEHLRSMKRELDFRGTLLGKTWAELSQLLGKYQSELVTKYDHLDNMLGSEGRDQITQLETSLDARNRDIERFQKTVHDLETKLLEKDGEIVQLRTDVHKLRNEVSIKDNLINKVQTQMAKESMEYSTEINTLKEIISVGESAMTSLDTSMELQPVSSGKRRKKSNPTNLANQTIENTQPSSSLETSSLELPLQLPLSSFPNPTSRLWRAGRPTSLKPVSKSSVDLMSNVELEMEEPVIKSEVEDDVMTALEQSTAEDGEPGTPMTPMKVTRSKSILVSRAGNSKVCGYCAKIFTTAHSRMEHERIHTGDKPFPCHYCGKSFTQSGTRSRHMASRHGDFKVRTCKNCNAEFLSSSAFRLHRCGRFDDPSHSSEIPDHGIKSLHHLADIGNTTDTGPGDSLLDSSVESEPKTPDSLGNVMVFLEEMSGIPPIGE